MVTFIAAVSSWEFYSALLNTESDLWKVNEKYKKIK